MKERRIGIIGQGFVGNSIKEGLKNDYPDLLTYDIKPELSMCSSLKELVSQCYYIFVCIPTPMQKDGKCFTGLVENVIYEINEIVSKENFEDPSKRINKIIILKTTVPPGTTLKFQLTYKELDFIFNPEFLTEKNAVNDFKNQNRIILGGISNQALNMVTDLYKKTFPFIPIVKMSSDEAEMVKYVTNTFLATKVIFANEMYQICQALKINYDNVINAAKLDIRLGNSHWGVPGHDGDFGFGGHCFPKDTHAIKYEANEKFIDTTLLDAVLKKNRDIRKNRDWEKQIGRAII